MDKSLVEPIVNPMMSIWDELYPIFSTKDAEGVTNHYVYISTYFESPNTFSEVIALLDTAPEGDRIIFKINSGGGYLDSVTMLIDAIRNSDAEVVADISGSVASAATMLTLACDDIYVAPHTSFMIHNYSGGVGGKGGEIKAHSSHITPMTTALYYDIYKGFLTKKEIKKVIKDKDFWMPPEEVMRRWENVLAKRLKAKEKAEKKAGKEQEQMLISIVEELGYDVKPKKEQ